MGYQTDTDYIEAGTGAPVILLHSSVAGARQWRSLMEDLAADHHAIAINLIGYGRTAPWTGPAPQTLTDQARLIAPVLPPDGPVSIVGHSFGGSVAMKAAALFKGRVRRLVLVEPNPFYLLKSHGRDAAFREAAAMKDVIKTAGVTGDWPAAAAIFADYWAGKGTWDAMPEDRRQKFAAALPPNLHEWDSVLNEDTPLPAWSSDLPGKTTVISARDTVMSIRETISLLREHIPHWRYETIANGGHMAALTRPDLIHPLIRSALM